MEEKDITFNIVTYENEDSEIPDINVTSDIDDNIEYATVPEKVSIICNLLLQCCEQIANEDVEVDDENPLEFDEDDKSHQAVINKLHLFTEDMIYAIINTIPNYMAGLFGKEPEVRNACVAVLENVEIEDGKPADHHTVVNTYYTEDAYTLDPLLACLDFSTDTALQLLENGVPKEEVKHFICTAVGKHLKENLENIIDEYEEDDKD